MYEVGDEIVGFGIIDKLSKSSAWIDNTTYRLSTLDSRKCIHKYNRYVSINWKNGDNVDKYFKSFKHWNYSMNINNNEIFKEYEIINNKILLNGEFYLPWYSYDKMKLDDGIIIAKCFKYEKEYNGKIYSFNLFIIK